MNNSKDLAVIIQTCDKYSDIWDGFYVLFNRYWQRCSYPTYHVTESKYLGQQNIQTIHTGNLEWSGRLLYALDKIDSEFILLLLEDYYLIKNVQLQKLEHSLSVLREHPKAAYFRIFPVPGPDEVHHCLMDVGVIHKNSAYSISTQATIWRKEALKSMLIPTETVWDFELNGSQRMAESDYELLGLQLNHTGNKAELGIYPYTYLCTAVYKGKWMREAIKLCKKENISLDLSCRKVETRFENFYRNKYHYLPLAFRHGLDYLKNILKND